MSIVMAKKKNGVVYMGADTEYSNDTIRQVIDSKENYKVRVLSNGVLLGGVGNVRNIQLMSLLSYTIEQMDLKVLNYDMVRSLSLKVYDILKEVKTLETVGRGFASTDMKLLIALKNRLFYMDESFTIIEIEDSIAIGAGEVNAIYDLQSMKDNEDPIDVMYQSFKSLTSQYLKVGGPYVFINTKNLAYEVRD